MRSISARSSRGAFPSQSGDERPVASEARHPLHRLVVPLVPPVGLQAVALQAVALLVVVLLVVALLAVVLLAPGTPAAAATPASEQELTARIAVVDRELAALAGEAAALEIDADQLRQRLELTTSRVAQLMAQRDATAKLHQTHVDLGHRRMTIEEVDAALDALLIRSGVAGGATAWYLTQLETMHTTGSTSETTIEATIAATAVGIATSKERYDPATSSIVRAVELPSSASYTDQGHLQLRYAVRASLVFAEFQLRLDHEERAAEGPRRQLDEVILPALEQAQERGRTLSASRDGLAAELALARERSARAERNAREERSAREDRLHVPVDGPHRISSPFGMRRHPVHGDFRMHHGIDLAAPVGTPVVAAAPGRVVAAGSRGGYGRTVDIDHGDGRLTRYAHLHTIEVARGDQLAGRAQIGTVGATGTVTGPHLHFEVRKHGQAVDPGPLLYGPSGRP